MYSEQRKAFKQVEIAYLAVISYLDKLVQPCVDNSSHWHRPGLASSLARLSTLTFRLVLREHWMLLLVRMTLSLGNSLP